MRLEAGSVCTQHAQRPHKARSCLPTSTNSIATNARRRHHAQPHTRRQQRRRRRRFDSQTGQGGHACLCQRTRDAAGQAEATQAEPFQHRKVCSPLVWQGPCGGGKGLKKGSWQGEAEQRMVRRNRTATPQHVVQRLACQGGVTAGWGVARSHAAKGQPASACPSPDPPPSPPPNAGVSPPAHTSVWCGAGRQGGVGCLAPLCGDWRSHDDQVCQLSEAARPLSWQPSHHIHLHSEVPEHRQHSRVCTAAAAGATQRGESKGRLGRGGGGGAELPSAAGHASRTAAPGGAPLLRGRKAPTQQ